MTLILKVMASLLLAVFNATVFAQGVDLRLCTAHEEGNYHAAGQEIAGLTDPANIAIELKNTHGSMDNLKKIAKGECDAGIVQIDAYLVYQQINQADRLKIKRPLHLYREYVHLICHRDTNIESIEDLAKNPTGNKVLIGSPGSGSSITWDSFRLQDSSYIAVPMEEIGDVAALESVQSGAASCLMFVSGLGSDFSHSVDQAGESLRLVKVDDEDLSKAGFAGNPIYTFLSIPSDTYGRLQAGTDTDLTTLTVEALLVVSSVWADTYPAEYDLLSDAVERAIPGIRQRVGNQ